MDTPLRAHYGLLVLKPYHAGLLWFAHHMTDLLTLGQIEVVVGLDAATMCVWWHGVPYATLLQLGQSHLQLAWTFLKSCIHNQLIDGALVTLSLGAQRLLIGTDDDCLQAPGSCSAGGLWHC